MYIDNLKMSSTDNVVAKYAYQFQIHFTFFLHSNRLNCIHLEQAKHSITPWDTDLYLFILQIGTVK